ncbi:MAG: hypothetical protein LEGION0398_MBIBDBAK_01250 [Legionellaceae bacterium]
MNNYDQNDETTWDNCGTPPKNTNMFTLSFFEKKLNGGKPHHSLVSKVNYCNPQVSFTENQNDIAKLNTIIENKRNNNQENHVEDLVENSQHLNIK